MFAMGGHAEMVESVVSLAGDGVYVINEGPLRFARLWVGQAILADGIESVRTQNVLLAWNTCQISLK